MIPYNPSSFDRNKTILEQILELKNWLKDHPSYEIFYSSENGNYLAYTGYLLSAIADPTNLAVGDVVIFSNVMVGVVTSIDTDNGTYGCDACVSFKGDTGATGQAGRSIRVSSENYVNDSTAYSRNNIQPTHTISEYDLVIFANDYLGYVSSVSGINFYVTATQNIKGADGTNGTNGTNGTDGKYISNVNVDGNGDLICTIYDPATSTSTQVNAGYVVGPAGQDGHGMSIINTTTLTGTLSASDLAKANGTDDCILIYTDNGVDLTMQRIMRDSSNVYFYSHFIDTGKAVCSICEVNAVTGAYTISGGDLPIKASNIDSDTATNGQVLTADGNGGASWQNAGGGGTTLNKYHMTVSANPSSSDYTRIKNICNNAKVILGLSITIGTIMLLSMKPETSTQSRFLFFGTSIDASSNTRIVKLNVSAQNYTTVFTVTMIDSSGTITHPATSGIGYDLVYLNDTEILS